MGHESTWLIEKRVILIVYIGDMSEEELGEINAGLEEFHNLGQAPIHIISDHRQMGKVNLSLNLLRDTFTALRKTGWGWVLLIGVDEFVRFFANIFAIQFGLKLKIVKSLEEAEALLRQVDSSLGE